MPNRRVRKKIKRGAALGMIAFTAVLSVRMSGPNNIQAQTAPPPLVTPLASLKTVPTPMPPKNLNNFLKVTSTGAVDPAAYQSLVVLGKALFWDQAVGSDGTVTVVVDALTGATKTVPIGQSCASCHFNAGADSRTKNQLNPGFRAIPPDNLFTSPFTVGYQLRVNDFPFHRLSDPNNVDSSVLFDTNDVASSEGTFRKHFLDIQFNNPTDLGSREDSIFNVKGQREVEPRNTPTTINAVFNFRNFWDGRARNEFNGVNPIGDLDPFARVLLSCVDNATGAQLKGSNDPKGKCKLHDGDLQAVAMTANMRLENSSLASQAVGPTLSDLEMSFNGRTFPKLGKKMLSLTKALPNQLVRADDSVLGPYASPADPVTFLPTTGLKVNYSYLIQRAFDQRFWDSPILIQIPGGTNADGTTKLTLITSGSPTTDTNTFTEMEYNFSLFWGLAIQAYEATLRADDSRLDQFFDGNTNALTAQEQLGLDVFTNKGRCVNCHGGAETTNASVSNVVNTEKLERMIMGDENVAVYDNGFYNTAVNRCAGLAGPCDDVGLGATIGPKNLPLSMSRFFQLPNNCKFGTTTIDGVTLTGCTGAPLIEPRPLEGLPTLQLLQPNERVAVDGSFKTPGLRNVELTAPYFHNGGSSTLEQVVDFYNRGGNFPQFNQNNFDTDVVPLELTSTEKAALVAVMKAMTDRRVYCQSAPFDHPQLFVPDMLDGGGTLQATGASSCVPLRTFVQNLAPAPTAPAAPGTNNGKGPKK